MSRRFPIVVVGAGHAGCEAACIAARIGVGTALVTMSLDAIAQMSCNPAIGGLAKGHLVREIDVLGGIMGRMADRAGIQFKMLNRARGPAVWSPRAQEDKALYRRVVREHLESVRGLTLVEAQVTGFLVDGDPRGARPARVRGVLLADGGTIECDAVIVTPGTFLNGLIHVGDVCFPAAAPASRPRAGSRMRSPTWDSASGGSRPARLLESIATRSTSRGRARRRGIRSRGPSPTSRARSTSRR